MKKVVSTAVLSLLGLAWVKVSAAAVPAVLGGVEQAEGIGLQALIRNAGQTLEVGAPNLFMVLGGGLIAVSLLARRKSK